MGERGDWLLAEQEKDPVAALRAGRDKCVGDAVRHLLNLAEAVALLATVASVEDQRQPIACGMSIA